MSQKQTSAFACHNHDACIDTSLRQAEVHCARYGLKLTPVRRRALEILLQEHRALGAYDLLAHLANEGLGSQPPVAYRALDFLVKAGFAHKIEAINAYIACTRADKSHTPAFLICRACNAVAEAQTTADSGRLGAAARDMGFAIERTVVEAQGLCPDCQ